MYFNYFALQEYLGFTPWDEATLLLAAQHMESLISKLGMAIEIMEQFPACGAQSTSGSPSIKCH
jgi:hypothetical protein